MIDYDYWRDLLAGKHPEMHADHPQPGFYVYQAFKGAPRLPVAIYYNRGTDELVAQVGYYDLFKWMEPTDIWTWVGDRGVTHEAYDECARTHAWPTEESGEYQRLTAVLNSLLAVPDDVDGGELEDLAVRFEEARKSENERHLQAKYAIDRKYREQIDRIKTALKALKERDYEAQAGTSEGIKEQEDRQTEGEQEQA